MAFPDWTLEVADLLQPELSITVTPGGAGADVEPLTQAGVPGAGLRTEGSNECTCAALERTCVLLYSPESISRAYA